MNFQTNIRILFNKKHLYKNKCNYEQFLEFTLGNMCGSYYFTVFDGFLW